MPLSRPAVALRAAQSLRSTRSQFTSIAAIRAFSTSKSQRAAGHAVDHPEGDHAADHHAHEDHYDPPTGWLFGVKPGETPEKEGWETIWVWGFFGSLGLGVVAYAFKPDTSIQTWALEEARRRLEVEGILKEPESK